MARTVLTPTTLPGPYSTAPVALPFTAADTVNNNAFPLTGNEILIVQNTDASAHTFTVTSAPDSRGRSGDIAAVSVPANSFMACQRFVLEGWQQSDGNLYLTANSNLVKFAVIKLP